MSKDFPETTESSILGKIQIENSVFPLIIIQHDAVGYLNFIYDFINNIFCVFCQTELLKNLNWLQVPYVTGLVKLWIRLMPGSSLDLDWEPFYLY